MYQRSKIKFEHLRYIKQGKRKFIVSSDRNLTWKEGPSKPVLYSTWRLDKPPYKKYKADYTSTKVVESSFRLPLHHCWRKQYNLFRLYNKGLFVPNEGFLKNLNL